MVPVAVGRTCPRNRGLGRIRPVTIFSTKFTDSLTGNAKLAGFSLTVTAVIGLTIMTILHAVLPVA